MPSGQPVARNVYTYLGLLLAIFGTPLFLWAFRLDVGEAMTVAVYLLREAVIFAMLGALLWIVRRGEKLPFASIGWHTDRLGRSLLWGLLGVLLCAVGLAACLGVAHLMHWKVGYQEAPKFVPPLWAMAITVLRAGVTEEVFYRGYALERLQALTGSRWIALLLALVPFALFHYRQGPAGILIAFVLGLILSLLYLKRRDLPANMVTHFSVDFIPNVLLPLFGAV